MRELPDWLGPRSLAFLEREMRHRAGARLLVQYVPHTLGLRAMNLPLCAWLASRARPYWVMFHEVAVPVAWTAPWQTNVLGVAHRAMAAIVARHAERIFVSTVAWNPLLARLAPQAPTPTWLPVPSNLPESVAPGEGARARARHGLSAGDVVIGTFGQYWGAVAERLAETLPVLLSRDRRRVVLLAGKGSEAFASRIFTRGERVIATGEQSVEALATSLAACDLAVQPYPDGVNTRRGSTMANLALGVPVATNLGVHSEPVWEDGEGLSVARSPDAEALLAAAERLLADAALRRAVGARGAALYRRRFSLDRTIEALRLGEAPRSSSGRRPDEVDKAGATSIWPVRT